MAPDHPERTQRHGGVRRLGKNHGRYFGETIAIESVLDQIRRLATAQGWTEEVFHEQGGTALASYFRRAETPRTRLYVSAGIHGDEPAGPLAILDLLRANRWPETMDITLCPCLNPTGFPLNSRESAAGLDLNRQYAQPEAPEIRAHIAWLDRQPAFDATLCLHEDWEAHGFYVYELDLDGRFPLADRIVAEVGKVCPIDPSPLIEGREAHGGIIRPAADLASRPQWPEAFYLIAHKTRLSCTLEAPSDFALEVRVRALVAGVRAVLDALP